MKLTVTTSLILLVLLASPVLADQPATTKNPSKVTTGSYTVEPYHTRVMFGVDHMGFSTYFGQFTDTSGTLNLTTQTPTSSVVDIKIATKSISTTNQKLDNELISPDWFDAARFPTIEFKSTRITRTGRDKARVTGDLTMHGVTKPVTLDAVFHGAGTNPLDKKYTVGFDAMGELKRSDFGIKQYLPMIGDTVELTISAAFEKQE